MMGKVSGKKVLKLTEGWSVIRYENVKGKVS